MNILKQKHIFFNRTNQYVPKQLRQLFLFGANCLAGQTVISLRGNARIRVSNYHTAKSKAYRLCRNRRWLTVFPKLLKQLDLVSERSMVAVDFSTFKHFQILTFAVQTRLGRAIPIYFEIITYPIKQDSQNIFIVQAIERFVSVIGCRPKLVMDRGFACPHVLRKLAEQSHPFVVRIKGVKILANEEKKLVFKARQSPTSDLSVKVYDHDLRLIVSDNPTNDNEPWYLITNDTISDRDSIITDYYHRFEIEEFFKDAKWLQNLEQSQVKKVLSMSVVLWFVILGWWFMMLLEQDTPVMQGKHGHDKLSFPRLIIEAILREQQCVIQHYLLVCMSGEKEVITV